MPALTVSIDNGNTDLIKYQGFWIYTTGSTSKYIHTTSQAGATATFTFTGVQVWVYCTIPAGSATNIISVTLDGDTFGPFSHTSNGSAVYDEVYFASSVLTNTDHTIVVTNGGVTNGNSPLILDRFVFQIYDEVPSYSLLSSSTTVSVTGGTPSVSSSSSSTSTASSPLSSSQLSPNPSSTIRSSFSSSPLPTGTSVDPTSSPSGVSSSSSSHSTLSNSQVVMIAAIVSCSLIVLLILFFVIQRKRRRSNLSKDAILVSSPITPSSESIMPTPFPPMSEGPTSVSAIHHSLPNSLLEKYSHQRSDQYQLGVLSQSTPTTTTPSPSPNVGSSSSSNSAGLLPVEQAVEPPPLATDIRLDSTEYDFPPPSYEQDPPVV